MEFWADLARDLMRLKPNKLPYFQKGSTYYVPYPASFVASLPPLQRR